MSTTAATLNRATILQSLLAAALFGAIALCPTQLCAAEPGIRPEQTVMELTKQLKLTGDERAVLEVVDWPEAFERTPLSSRDAFSIKSPEDLKAFYVETITNSPLLGLRQAGAVLNQLPPEKRKALEKQTQRLARGVDGTPVANRYANTLFEFKKTIVDPEYATVQIYMTEHGSTKEVFVQLIKRGDKWMFPCVQIVADPLNVCR